MSELSIDIEKEYQIEGLKPTKEQEEANLTNHVDLRRHMDDS